MTRTGEELRYAHLYGVQSFAADVMAMQLSDPQNTLLGILEDQIINGSAKSS